MKITTEPPIDQKRPTQKTLRSSSSFRISQSPSSHLNPTNAKSFLSRILEVRIHTLTTAIEQQGTFRRNIIPRRPVFQYDPVEPKKSWVERWRASWQRVQDAAFLGNLEASDLDHILFYFSHSLFGFLVRLFVGRIGGGGLGTGKGKGKIK